MNDSAPINAESAAPASHKSIATALASAQAKMGKALKSASNPHFGKKYADLASVCDACLPALNDAGIAVIQPTTDDGTNRFVETILIHGESGETLKCRVPLIVQKNDMQGYGSAVTYARRYGLMSMAGIAPEDDDGNAAAKAAPPKEEAPRLISADQYQVLRTKADEAGVEHDAIAAAYQAPRLAELKAGDYDRAIKKLDATISAKRPADKVDTDEIPY